MKTRLKYLVSTIWIANMIFLFGSIYSLLVNDKGLLPPIYLGAVGLFFIIFVYLTRDCLKLNRPKVNYVIVAIFILSGVYYIFILNLIMVIPTFLTGILLFRKIKKKPLGSI